VCGHFTGIALSQPGPSGAFIPYVTMGFVVGFFGLIVIWAAFRRPGP
jgi:amino acid permease